MIIARLVPELAIQLEEVWSTYMVWDIKKFYYISVDNTCRTIGQELICTMERLDLTSELKRDLEILDGYSDAQIEVHEDIASWLCNGIGSCL